VINLKSIHNVSLSVYLIQFTNILICTPRVMQNNAFTKSVSQSLIIIVQNMTNNVK